MVGKLMAQEKRMHSSTPHSEQLLVIEPGGRAHHYWYDLWRYRELFLILAWRDVSVRYKQTVIGLLWALIRPLLTMVVFTIIFGRVAGLPSDGPIPYALMVFAGLLPGRSLQPRSTMRPIA